MTLQCLAGHWHWNMLVPASFDFKFDETTLLRQQTGRLCEASPLNPSALLVLCGWVYMHEMCCKGCVCVHWVHAVCVVACAVVLVEGLCKCFNLTGFAWVQPSSWIMTPALFAGGTHLKEQQEEAAVLSFLSFSSAVAPSLTSVSGRWQKPRLAGAVEDLANVSFPPIHFLFPLTLCCYKLERSHSRWKTGQSGKMRKPLCFLMVSTSTLSLLPVPPLLSVLTLYF